MSDKAQPLASNRVKTIVLVSFLAMCALPYLYGSFTQANVVNMDMSQTDQSAYMRAAQTVCDSGFTYSGDRNRMPAYLFLQALFYRPDMTEAPLLEHGKSVNIYLSLVLLAGILLLFRRHFSPVYLELPRNMAGGDYRLVTGLYELATQQRAPLQDDASGETVLTLATISKS